jgi:hypothetical protein
MPQRHQYHVQYLRVNGILAAAMSINRKEDLQRAMKAHWSELQQSGITLGHGVAAVGVRTFWLRAPPQFAT